MAASYRFAVLSYSAQIKQMLQALDGSDEYSIEYVPISYKKAGLGSAELLRNGYDVCLVYSSYAYSVIEYVGNDVVDINKSDMDRARALLHAKQFSETIGLPIQKHERVNSVLLEQLCDVHLHTLIYDSPEELRKLVFGAREQGVNIFVGGGLVSSFCDQCNAHCIPILPEIDSLTEAVDKALHIARLKKEAQTKHEQLLDIFKLFKDGILYIDSNRKVTYSNVMARNLFNISNIVSDNDFSDKITDGISHYYHDLGVDEVMNSSQSKVDHFFHINNRDLLVNTMPVSTHHNKNGVAVFLRDIDSVHDSAGKVRAMQRKQSGFISYHTVSDLKGRSSVMEQVRSKIRLYAPHDAPVLIHGETGTGKDLVAQALHNASGRKRAPFVAINCAAIPESLLESELFGYDEGAFTGAKKGGKAGLIEMAHTGTLFLDEVGELSQNAQLRLLRVLENKEITRVGGSRVIPVNIRIISASHRALPELIRSGQFRSDLFYRLAVLRLQLPPLRHRLEDIPMLIEKLLIRHGRDKRCLSPAILDALQQYHWPGNIRELRSILESYLIMLGGSTHDEHLFMSIFSDWVKDFTEPTFGIANIELSGDLKTILEETKRRVVMEIVARCGFNKKKAAQQLGISYNTLWRILGSMEEVNDPALALADPNSVTMGIVDPAS